MTSDPHFEGCEVVRQLRSGPATVWYLGRQVSLGRPVVIKALSPNVLPDSAFAEPLAREAQVLARLHHPNIVQLYDYVNRDTRMWQVLEFVDGWTLDQVQQELGKFSMQAALAVCLMLCRTLEYVHQQQIVHRDVQPRNIWISTEGEIKLGNFFLAVDQSAGSPAERLETETGFSGPSYMSPEQVLGEPADARSDLFSLGVVLYELLCGKRPFDAEDNRSTSQRIRHEPPTPLSQLLPDLPPAVERIIHRALQKLPADRFADAGEMSRVLEQALSQFGDANPQPIIQEALAGANMVEAQPPPAAPARIARDLHPVISALRFYAACTVLIVAGSFSVEHFLQGNGKPAEKNTTLELLPKQGGSLRAVARPWAHVFVDGQQVATTPFATPIPLRPGTHYVRFDHPKAPSEHRTISVHPQQSIFLDVQMRLDLPQDDPDSDLMKPPSQPDGGVRSP